MAKRVDKVDGKNLGDDAMVPTTLHNALRTLGSYEKWRTRLVDLCRGIEQDLNLPNRSVRDEITGPLIDALHTDVGTLKKVLKSGVVFEFKYCSKIGRAFVLSPEAKPDHVWEPQTTKLLIYLATNARHIAIGGAYFGDQAILVANKLAETGGICHAFEPNKEQFAMLERNARNNGLNKMMLNCIGLWENDKTILRLVGNDAFAYSKVVTAQSSQLDDSTFPTISLNTYGKQHNIDRFDLIMLDLEGTELPALRGADRYLDQPPDSAPHIIFEVHRNYVDWSNGLENTDIVRFLVNFGYYVFAIRDFQSNFPMGDQPIELIPPESTYLKGPPHGFNMFAVKNLGVIQNDFFRMCHDVSPKLLLHKSRSLHYPTTGL
jgi:FkbM family methyltransferase